MTDTMTGTETNGAAAGTGANGAGEGTGGSGGADGDKTFTQDEVNRIVSERLARDRAKLGDVEELKRKAAEFDQLQEAQKTELEKAIGKATKEAADNTRAEVNKTWADRIVKAEVRVAAAGKLADPEDAVRLIDVSDVKVDDGGEVDVKSIDAKIADLLKDKPYLAANGTQRRTDFDAGARTPAKGGEDMNTLLRRAAGRS